MRRLTTSVCLTLTLLLGSVGVSWSAEANWSILKSNSFLWGQTTGCILRFDNYSNLTAGPLVKKEQIQQMLKNFLGDLDGVLEQLVKIGKEHGHFGDMSYKEFEEMILFVSKEESTNKMTWLQSLGCYKNLRDLNIIK
jgi:hypothetical protein